MCKVVSQFKDGDMLTKSLNGREFCFYYRYSRTTDFALLTDETSPKFRNSGLKQTSKQTKHSFKNNWKLTFSLNLGASFCYLHRCPEIFSCSCTFTHFAISDYELTESSSSQWENFLCKSNKLFIRSSETGPAPSKPFPTVFQNGDY